MNINGKQWIRSRRRRCILISLAVFLFIVLLFVILGVTVFRVREATTTVNSVKLGGFKAGFNLPNLGVDLNVTLDLDLTAHNPNHASFRYGESSAELFYKGSQVGEAAIPPGQINAGGSERMNVSVTIFAGRLIGDSALYSDVLSGSLVFQTTTRIPGRVSVLGIFKHHIVTYSSCDVTVNVSSRTADNSNCRYRAKL
ncbi:uncharacterized protein LOC110098765 [Dendrobium catenatum]|uniref:Late embryogenesis abundant protein LEA-2 subgroup domain-containing protein n=1 Tax=Dendrobium catenatum TaxID=906689 RepID=A0A2I0WKB3_9ASPA|nr:uncharacterized protein LOC110098765 [Dendrobium catenatum]PKU76097.1 hypothetical protein MA16_Dca011465 [Dendrobium catenatum]